MDPASKSGRLEDPPTWNGYLHVRNTPTRLLDTKVKVIGDFLSGVKNGLLTSYAFNEGRIDASTQGPGFTAQGRSWGTRGRPWVELSKSLSGPAARVAEPAAAATGLGSPVGVPLTAGPAALAAHGGSISATGTANAIVGLNNLAFKKGDKSTTYSDAQREHFQRTLDKEGVPALQRA